MSRSSFYYQPTLSKDVGIAAETAAKAISAIAGFGRGAAKFLARKSILEEKELLNLDPPQVKQAKPQKTAAEGAVTVRLPEAY